jgi:hypothetical protein
LTSPPDQPHHVRSVPAPPIFHQLRDTTAEVQSELSQVVRFFGFFRFVSSTQPQEPEGEESRHLVEALGRGHRHGPEAVRHGGQSKKDGLRLFTCLPK